MGAFLSEAVPRRPIHHDRIRAAGVVVQVDAVAGVGLDVPLPAPGAGEGVPGGALGPEQADAVPAAEDEVVLTVEVEDVAGEGGGRVVERGLGDELADGEGELGALGVDEDLGVEVRVAEEGVLVVVPVGPGQVAGRAVGEARRLVLRREVEGRVADELELVVEDVRVGGEDDAVRQGGKGRGQRVGELAAPAVADVEDFLGGNGEDGFGDLARADGRGERGEHGELDRGLDFGVGVRLGGEAAAEAVPGEGAVAGGESGGDVAVGVVLGRGGQVEVPVRFVEAEPVGEQLESGGFGGGFAGGAVLGGYVERLGEGRQVDRPSCSVTGSDYVGQARGSVAIWQGIGEGRDYGGDVGDGHRQDEGCAVPSGLRIDQGGREKQEEDNWGCADGHDGGG